MITFSSWLKNSNEAKPFRDAFDLSDKMPNEFSIKLGVFSLIQTKCEDVWQTTKRDLSIDEGRSR